MGQNREPRNRPQEIQSTELGTGTKYNGEQSSTNDARMTNIHARKKKKVTADRDLIHKNVKSK